MSILRLSRLVTSLSCIAFSMLFMTSCVRTKTQEYGTVIILNGTSAVGKSSIIRAFQSLQFDNLALDSKPWLGIGIDNFFVGVLPPKFYLEDKPEHHAVMHGIASQDALGKLFTLHIGSEGQKVIKGMHRAIAAYAKTGNNVIVDYIAYEPDWLEDLKLSLQGMKVIFVGAKASLATVEQREKERKTSPEGHARSIFDTVHQGWDYDLVLDTDNITPQEAAQKIKNLVSGS